MNDFFGLYNKMLTGIDTDEPITAVRTGLHWTAVETAGRFGMAMTTVGHSIAPGFPDGPVGLPLSQAAQAVKSWNFREASWGMAAVNACYNTTDRLAALHAAADFDRYCTDGLNLSGARIGVVGHLNMPDFVRQQAEDLLILEQNPRPGDYPDSACDWILPTCDIVLITGSTLVNKTLPHLLELCKHAYTILTGPTVPMCPALLEHGIDRLAGLVITDPNAMTQRIVNNTQGSPYGTGQCFLLQKQA